jgi:two-component system sensor histidine kinase/response regulator
MTNDRILIVDDAPDNLFLVQSILMDEGYDSCLADNGAAALHQIEQSPPDLVLLDVMMPGMDGFEVTRRIRANATLPFIPILLITADDRASAVQGLDSGADDFIRKPIEVEELLARVRSLLRLKHSVDERDAIAREREDFVSRLTHDLRTPLLAADRTLALFAKGTFGELAPSMQEAIAIMARSNRNLLEMVNTLLEVYRYEAGRKTLHFTEVDLAELLVEVLEELMPLAQAKKLKVNWQFSDRVQPVRGDRLELRRVFANLICNAIKFTDKGEIRARLAMVNDAVEIAIADTGCGIPKSEQATLFERFRPGSHKRSGSGLGLYLSRCILETHGGAIAVESQPGEGSCFRARLPPKTR